MEKIPQIDSNISLFCTSTRGAGGAANTYTLEFSQEKSQLFPLSLKFQEGGIPANGVNGITNEILLEIVKHRLQCFQNGPFPCKENAIALEYVEKALAFLYQRTADRKFRGVEGQEKP